MMQKLNTNELTINLNIAKRVGIKEAIMLSALKIIHDDNVSGNLCFEDGKHWIKMSYKDIINAVGLYSQSTIMHAINNLVSKEFIIAKKRHEHKKVNEKEFYLNWYTLNHEVIEKFLNN